MNIIKGLLGLIAVIIVVITVYYIVSPPSREIDGKKGEERSVSQGKERETVPDEAVPPRKETSPQAERKIAIIIDDIGYNLSPVEELLALEAPIAFAILPNCPHSSEAAEMIHGAKREILLHLPMEPLDPAVNPGEGALFRSMSARELRQGVAKDLRAVPYARGVNNHMGSAFMAEEDKLSVVLQELQEKRLFFIDSKTTANSRAENLAKRMKLRFAARTLFLDNDKDERMIYKTLMSHLEKSGPFSFVIIGHPYPATVRALQEAVPLVKARGILIVAPSALTSIVGAELN